MYNICEDTEENFASDLYEVFLFPIDDGHCKMKISRVMKISRQEGTCRFTRCSRYRELLANFSLQFSRLPSDVTSSPTRGDVRVNRVYSRSPTPV